MPPQETRTQFILIGAPQLISALTQVARDDPEIDVVSIAGPPQAPERLVALMPPARAELLRRALGAQLLIEPDEPLPGPDDPVGPYR
jgi:hypothetical protein